MPFEIWFLLGLLAVGLLLWLVERVTGRSVTDSFGRALAVLFLLAVLAGAVYGAVQIATGGGSDDSSAQPERGECFPYAPGSC